METLPVEMEEPATVARFGFRLGHPPSESFAFPDEAGPQAHLSGRVAAALMAKAAELLSAPPSIEKVDVLAANLPGVTPQKAFQAIAPEPLRAFGAAAGA